MRKYTWMKNTPNYLYKNIYAFLFFRKELKLLWFVRQTEGVETRLIALVIHNFFSWPEHAGLSSKPT